MNVIGFVCADDGKGSMREDSVVVQLKADHGYVTCRCWLPNTVCRNDALCIFIHLSSYTSLSPSVGKAIRNHDINLACMLDLAPKSGALYRNFSTCG